MKLDRNIEGNKGRGKYAILKLRQAALFETGKTFGPRLHPTVGNAIKTLEKAGILDWGISGTEAEFFLIRLKDKYARAALMSYADAARHDDPEYASEIDEMANRAGSKSPFCQRPD